MNNDKLIWATFETYANAVMVFDDFCNTLNGR